MPETVSTVVPLDAVDLAVSSVLVLLAAALSLAARLGLERRLLLAALRTVAQLLLVGFVLEWVFAIDNVLPLLGVMTVMILMAGRVAAQRSRYTFPGAKFRATASLAVISLVTTLATTSTVISTESWLAPRYVIPLLGMVLGNSLTGISLCLDELLTAFEERRERVETELALGATRWEAARGPVREAIRRGMIPIVNSMMVVGIVSLPGMMTGQILAGAPPVQAVRYQIVIMFLIAAATSFSCVLVAWLVYRRLFTARHQLRHIIVTAPKN